ncbi:MAG: hypothetical protein J7518_18390 [Nocardioidaceae bacterium]|nr:hypothetical protein [Nocardioidaceae bacterium]
MSETKTRRRLRRPSVYEILAITIALLGVSGVAYAAIPSANGTISGCYMKSGGTLRVIDPTNAKCKTSETSLTWNIQGLPGADGTDGTDGTDGADGADGVSGYEMITAESTHISFDGNRLDVFAKCPAGKRFLGGGFAFYLVPPGFAPQYTPPERVNALPETDFEGIDQYYVTVIHPIPDGYGAKLVAKVACATMATP